jgi:alpha-1,2-mannosyltransferase
MNSFARRIAWAILLLRLAYFDVLEILRARSINDYGPFHAAAIAIREGLDPYSFDDLQQAARIGRLPAVHPYFYPPLLAELLLPATWLTAFDARLVWMVLTIASFLGAIALLQRWLGHRDVMATTSFLVAVCALWPLRSTQMMGQVNGMVLLLIVLWWVHRERSPWAGGFLGLAAAIKMSPLLLVLVPLSERRLRESLVVTGTAGGLVLGSCALLGARGMRFFGDVATGFLPGHQYHGLDVPIDLAGNHSIAALAYGIFDGAARTDPLHLSTGASIFQVCAILALLAGVAFAVRRGATIEGRTAALVVVMIIAPTYGFEHHVAFVVLAIALVCLLVAQGALRTAWMWALVVALGLLTEHEASFVPPDWAPRGWVVLGHASKLVPLLAVYAAGLVARRGERGGGSGGGKTSPTPVRPT